MNDVNMTDVKKFIDQNKNSLLPRSQWFYLEGINVYLRVGKHKVCNEIKLVVTVSNVTNSENPDSITGQGYFRSLMKDLEAIVAELPEVEGILIENVITPRLGEILERNNYVPTDKVFDGLMTIYYKEIK